jgi:hypothetical protein
MPAYLPIPEGLQIPEGDMFDLTTTYRIEEGQLYPVAVDGIPFVVEEPETPEGEQEMPEGEDGGGFQAAIEKAMAAKAKR